MKWLVSILTSIVVLLLAALATYNVEMWFGQKVLYWFMCGAWGFAFVVWAPAMWRGIKQHRYDRADKLLETIRNDDIVFGRNGQGRKYVFRRMPPGGPHT